MARSVGVLPQADKSSAAPKAKLTGIRMIGSPIWFLREAYHKESIVYKKFGSIPKIYSKTLYLAP